MATLNIGSNYYYSGKGPFDAKLAPVETMDDLISIPQKYRYDGMTVYVKSEKKEYWYVQGDTGKYSWEPKSFNADSLSLVSSADTEGNSVIGIAQDGKLIKNSTTIVSVTLKGEDVVVN